MWVVLIISGLLDSNRFRLAQRNRRGSVTTVQSFWAMVPVEREKVVEVQSLTAYIALRKKLTLLASKLAQYRYVVPNDGLSLLPDRLSQ